MLGSTTDELKRLVRIPRELIGGCRPTGSPKRPPKACAKGNAIRVAAELLLSSFPVSSGRCQTMRAELPM